MSDLRALGEPAATAAIVCRAATADLRVDRATRGGESLRGADLRARAARDVVAALAGLFREAREAAGVAAGVARFAGDLRAGACLALARDFGAGDFERVVVVLLPPRVETILTDDGYARQNQ